MSDLSHLLNSIEGSESNFTDVFFPKCFNDTTVSMPLMDADDYFIREGRLTWHHKGATLEVSVELFELDDSNTRVPEERQCLS